MSDGLVLESPAFWRGFFVDMYRICTRADDY